MNFLKKFIFLLLIVTLDNVCSIANLDLSLFESLFASLQTQWSNVQEPIDELVEKYKFDYKNFNQWYKECKKKLQLYRKIGQNFTKTTLTLDELDRARTALIDTVKQSSLGKAENWVSKAPSNLSDQKKPFLQKIIVPEDSQISVHADLHGDIHSVLELIKSLQDKGFMEERDGFKIKKGLNFYISFLGDYEDRGNYGTEVLYTLMRLKIANPENVLLARGNHEDPEMNLDFGFHEEFMTKFANDQQIKSASGDKKALLTAKWLKFCTIYNVMPMGIYVGSYGDKAIDYLLFCHGGIELGYDPQILLDSAEKIKYQFLGPLNQQAMIKKLGLSSFIKPSKVLSAFKDYQNNYKFRNIGFIWNDFQVNLNEPVLIPTRRGFSFNKELTVAALERLSKPDKFIIRGLFRGHQHSTSANDMMNSLLKRETFGSDSINFGVSKLWITFDAQKNTDKLWPNIICTFLVGPDSGYGKALKYGSDAYGILHIKKDFNNWTLTMHKQKIID